MNGGQSDEHGRVELAGELRGVLHSEVLPGFWLQPEWLWQAPLPKRSVVLAQLLAD